jgi:carboxyl-terminal processing protease
MKRIHVIQVLILVAIAFIGGYFFGVNKIKLDWKNFHPSVTVQNQEPPAGLINVDFSPFWIVWQRLSANYYDKTKLDQQKMLNGAISGMVNALGDPFTMYLPPVQNTNFKQSLAGEFSGIGAELGMQGKDIVVIAPLDGSPAEKTGIKTGDIITAVDGQSTVSWSLSDAVGKIRGTKGTDVTITVTHKSDKKSQKIKITRDTIQVKSVAMAMLSAECNEKGCNLIPKGDPCTKSGCIEYAYLRLSQFGDNTNKEWESMIKGIVDKLKSDSNVKGVILDLRNNPGGYLTDAQFIAAEFLPEGTKIVSEEPCNPGQDCVLNAQRKGLLADTKIKVEVLINGGSASASEIVSGALRDNKRAILIGEKSFGKGTVQQAEDLGDGAGLHVTIAKWLTPNGTWVHQKGLTPDITVSLDPKQPAVDVQLAKAVMQLLK